MLKLGFILFFIFLLAKNISAGQFESEFKEYLSLCPQGIEVNNDECTDLGLFAILEKEYYFAEQLLSKRCYESSDPLACRFLGSVLIEDLERPREGMLALRRSCNLGSSEACEEFIRKRTVSRL